MPIQQYTPVIRSALLAAIATPNHTLRRAAGNFVALGTQATSTSRSTAVPSFTRRAVMMLEREGLARFDDPNAPSSVTLTESGITAAQQLQAAHRSSRRRA